MNIKIKIHFGEKIFFKDFCEDSIASHVKFNLFQLFKHKDTQNRVLALDLEKTLEIDSETGIVTCEFLCYTFKKFDGVKERSV